MTDRGIPTFCLWTTLSGQSPSFTDALLLSSRLWRLGQGCLILPALPGGDLIFSSNLQELKPIL